MKNKVNGLSLINGIAIFIFFILTIIGIIGICSKIGYSLIPISGEDVSYASLFIVGSFGLIVELLIYNMKSMKK